MQHYHRRSTRAPVPLPDDGRSDAERETAAWWDIRLSLHEEISRRAYSLWEIEGRPAGRDKVHWDMAEAELVHQAGMDGADI